MNSDLVLLAAEDELELARRNLAAAERERERRAAAVEAVDQGLSGFWAGLTGTREQRRAEAQGALDALDAHLAGLRAQFEHARDKVDRARHAIHADAEAALDAYATREARLRRAAEGSPAVRALLTERDALQARIAALDEAGHAGSALLSSVANVFRSSRSMAEHSTAGNLPGAVGVLLQPARPLLFDWRNEVRAADDLREAGRGIDAYPALAEHFREALAKVGGSYDVAEPTGAAIPPFLSMLVDDVWMERLLASHALRQAEEWTALHSRIYDVVTRVDAERRATIERLRALDADLG